MRMNRTSAYQEMLLSSRLLEVPRGSYQRELNPRRVRKIAAAFESSQGQLPEWPLLCI